MTSPRPRPRPPSLPRDAWPEHPHYPSQTLLLDAHRSFLEVSGVLIRATRGGEGRDLIESLYHRWIGAMRSHEGYEEDKLYPYLSRRWQLSFDAAEKGHRDLHEAHDEVVNAFALQERSSIVGALERHHEVLEAHLRLEEDLVIPALLGMSPDEFNRYYEGDLPTLLRDLETERG